jgi:hypothetical protein
LLAANVRLSEFADLLGDEEDTSGGQEWKFKSGRHDHARAELSAAIALCRALEMTFWLSQVEATLAEVEGR